MNYQQHQDEDVSQAIIRLCDALCSWERDTGRQSVVIIRENNGEMPGVEMTLPGFCFRADCGKPLDESQNDNPDSHLLKPHTYPLTG